MTNTRVIGKLVVLAAARQGFTIDELKEALLLDDKEIEDLVEELYNKGLIDSRSSLTLSASGEAAASEALRLLGELVVKAIAGDEEAVRALAPFMAVIPYIVSTAGGQELDPSEIIVSYLSSAKKRAS